MIQRFGFLSRFGRLAGVAVLASLLLSGCSYNTLQTQDEAANAAWSEVQNQYQRRAELIPNLVNTVKAYATHEEKVFTEVAQARSRAGQIKLTADDLSDEAKMHAFSQAQGELSSALSRLMMVTENYPELKADQSFMNLQVQLEGTENRIALARNRYIEAVRVYNNTVRQFPSNITAKIFGMKRRANFAVSNESYQQAPQVNFN